MENVNNDFYQDFDEFSASNQLVYGERVDSMNDISFDADEESTNDDNNNYQESIQSPDYQTDEPEDFINKLLKSKGISPDAVKFVNDDGSEEEIPFHELSDDEKLYVLNYKDTDNLTSTSTKQIQQDPLLQELEKNGLTIDDYVNLRLQSELEKYNSTPESYQVDSITDDELYTHNMSQIYPDLTEDDILNSLRVEKENPDLYTKKMSSLRQAYKAEEEKEIQRYKEQEEETMRQAQQEFENAIMDASRDFKEISVIDLEKSDVDDALNILFRQDATGQTEFAKAINDPKQLLKMAWFISKGEDAINMIVEHFKDVVSENRKQVPAEQEPNQESSKKVQTYNRPAKEKTNTRKPVDLPESLQSDIYQFRAGSINDINYDD